PGRPARRVSRQASHSPSSPAWPPQAHLRCASPASATLEGVNAFAFVWTCTPARIDCLLLPLARGGRLAGLPTACLDFLRPPLQQFLLVGRVLFLLFGRQAVVVAQGGIDQVDTGAVLHPPRSGLLRGEGLVVEGEKLALVLLAAPGQPRAILVDMFQLVADLQDAPREVPR